ncbi:MAG: hypothetical protein V4654_04510 [Bdellovibrionota bacterium]
MSRLTLIKGGADSPKNSFVHKRTHQSAEHVLAKALADYVLLRSNDPIQSVIESLYEIEIEAAKMVNMHFESKSEAGKKVDFIRSLPNVYSFLKFDPKKSLKNENT